MMTTAENEDEGVKKMARSTQKSVLLKFISLRMCVCVCATSNYFDFNRRFLSSHYPRPAPLLTFPFYLFSISTLFLACEEISLI